MINKNKCFLLFLGLTLFLGGCAAEKLPRFIWPMPPEQPRLEFIGNYYNESSFEKSRKELLLSQITGGSGDANFSSPYGVATDGKGLVYVSDIHLKNVRIYNFNNKTVNFLTKETVMGSPVGMAVDSQGNLYIADSSLSRIYIYGPDHSLRQTISNAQELSKPVYITVNEKLGRLYVSDALKHRIVVFSLGGDYLFSFGGLGGDQGHFYAPQGLTFGPDGNLYVADMLNARVQVLTPDGTFIRMFGERGDQNGQFESPKDLAFDSDGNLHVIEGRRSEIATFTPEGVLLLNTGSGAASDSPFGFGAPRSIAIDSSDRIYVAEMTNKRFSAWQYMSAGWLAKHPYGDADRQFLLDYMKKEH